MRVGRGKGRGSGRGTGRGTGTGTGTGKGTGTSRIGSMHRCRRMRVRVEPSLHHKAAVRLAPSHGPGSPHPQRVICGAGPGPDIVIQNRGRVIQAWFTIAS